MEILLFFKGITLFWQNRINRALIIIIAFFITLASVFYFIAGNRAEKSLAEQMLHREQIVVRAGADSIKSFLELSSDSLKVLARDYWIINQGRNTQATLDEFIADWEDTSLVEVILIDKDGEIVFIANSEKVEMETGISVSDRDYFIAASSAKAGEVFFGEPILPRQGAFEGQYLGSIATPIYEGSEFKGVLASGILLSKLTKVYLDPLRISEETRVHLIDSSGVFLSTSFLDLTGKSMFSFIEENPFPGSDLLIKKLKEELASAGEKKEGKLDYIRNDYYKKDGLEQMLLSYSAINLDDRNFWILAVETPKEDAMAFFGPFYRNQTAALIIAIFMFLIFAGLLIFTARVTKRDGYIQGFTDGQNHRKKI